MPEERVIKTDAVVLRRSDFGESDYLLTIYTPRHGKMKALSKGARKATARQTGQVEPFTLTDLIIHKGRELPIITQADTRQPFLPLRENLERGIYAAHFAELIDRFAYENEENRPAFDLLVSGLSWLCDKSNDLSLVARYYEFHILRVMGFEPELFQCVINGEDLQAEDCFFSSAEGGVVCPQCATLNQSGALLPLSLGIFKVLRYFKRNKWNAVTMLRLREQQANELERILHHYLTYLLERRLQSADFLRQLKRDLP